MAVRFRPRRKWPLALLLLVVIVVLLRGVAAFRQTHPPEGLSEGTYEIQRVVDGDTLLLKNGARVRLLGVDTPETKKPGHPVEPFGPEASRFTEDFVAAGAATPNKHGAVRLEFDRERMDRYGRFLAWVFVGEKMLNEELVRAGLSPAKVREGYYSPYRRRLRTAEEEAKAAGKGIWSLEKSTGDD